jgi:hypothetical protein
MPSLFTHLLIAQDSRSQLASPGLRRLVTQHEKAYYLGALAPDLPYFDIFHSYRGLQLGTFLSPLSHTMEERVMAWLGWSLPRNQGWAQQLHSVGTFKTLKAWAHHAQKRHPAFLALVAGMATHVAADEVLHPKINADSGDPDSAEGMQKHRTLEINLDFVLLRSRGFAIEGLSQAGMMERFLGRPGRQGDFLSPGQKAAWTETSRACDLDPVTRPELDRWSHGFAGAMRWLDHRFSPVEQQRRVFMSGGEERWRTFFARERYLSSHVPRACATAALWMDRLLAEPVAGVVWEDLAGV